MKLKLPPAVVTAIFGILMYFFAKFSPFGYYDFVGRKYVAFALLGIALFIGVFAVVQFFIEKTTIDPRTPEKVSRLVTNSLYAYSRNPMYVALLLVLLGFGLWLGNVFNSIMAIGFVYYMNYYQILPEEDVLFNRFDQEYKVYCSKVRRWL